VTWWTHTLATPLHDCYVTARACSCLGAADHHTACLPPACSSTPHTYHTPSFFSCAHPTTDLPCTPRSYISPATQPAYLHRFVKVYLHTTAHFTTGTCVTLYCIAHTQLHRGFSPRADIFDLTPPRTVTHFATTTFLHTLPLPVGSLRYLLPAPVPCSPLLLFCLCYTTTPAAFTATCTYYWFIPLPIAVPLPRYTHIA